MARGHGTHVTGFKDLSGRTFGLWSVVSRAPNKGSRTAWICRCACGSISSVASVHLMQGKSSSCGCSKAKAGAASPNYRHGGSSSRLYQIWAGMIQRCTNPRHKSFPDYGARGIAVCAEWREDFGAFAAHVGEPPKGCSIDRIDNGRGYEPGNVKWALPIAQSRNRRGRHVVVIRGQSMPLAEAVEKYGNGTKYSTAHNRLKRGQTIEEALRNG